MYASRSQAKLSVCEVDDSGYWDAVCKPRLPAFSWLTHTNHDSLRIRSTMKIAFAGKTDYLKIIDFRPVLRLVTRQVGWTRRRDKTKNFRFLVWIRSASGYTASLLSSDVETERRFFVSRASGYVLHNAR